MVWAIGRESFAGVGVDAVGQGLEVFFGAIELHGPISLFSYIAKGLLPYHGLGSGIKRAIEKWPEIDFMDDRDGCLFTATVHRKPAERLEEAVKPSVKSSVKILDLLRQNGELTIPELSEQVGITTRAIEKNIKKLQDSEKLRRVGPDKGGHWEVVE